MHPFDKERRQSGESISLFFIYIFNQMEDKTVIQTI